MTIFDSEHERDFRTLITTTTSHFNDVVGNAYGIHVSLCDNSIESLSERYREVAKLGIPDRPGPFKQLAAFAVLSQEFDLFAYEAGPQQEPDLQIAWTPRLALWSLTGLSKALSLNGTSHPLLNPVLPTAHFQAEFINHLRSFLYGRLQAKAKPSSGLLLERILSTALTLEAASYAGDCRDSDFTNNASECLEKIAESQILADDIRFNDPTFLDIIGGIGLED